MKIVIDDIRCNILLHDLSHIAKYLDNSASHFDQVNMKMYQNRLLEIRQELLECIDTKDN